MTGNINKGIPGEIIKTRYNEEQKEREE